MQIPIFGLGQQGKSPNVTAQHRLNLYYEIQPAPGDKANIVAYCTPGLALYANPSGNQARGMYWMESVDLLYLVSRGVLYEIAPNGVATARGTLDMGAVPPDTDGRVSMADNGVQLIIATGRFGYIYTPGTLAFAQITDADFPGADTVCFLDSFFIVNKPGTGQFWISSSYDGASWNALDYATAESNPDSLVAVVADRGALVLFGSISTELWINNGAQSFPFSRVAGAPIEYGLYARWSLAKCGGMWTGLFRNRTGQFSVARLNGSQIEKITTPDLDFLLNGYTTPGDAVAFAYSMAGHSFYQITFQGQGVTWLYDATSNAWSQLQSTGFTRHLGDLAATFGMSVIVSDFQSGQLYTLTSTALTDNGSPIPREITGAHLFSIDHLNLMRVQRLRIDMEGGVGTTYGQGADPTAMLQISRDGGHTWGGELWTTWGKLGEYRRRAEWRRLGMARDFVFKLRITDPVKVTILAAYIEFTESGA